VSIAELKKKFGRNAKSMMNRAIRAECHGGGEALEALTLARNLTHHRGGVEADTMEAELYLAVLEIVDAMEDAIREKYSLQPRPSRDDGARSNNRHSGRKHQAARRRGTSHG
jgi:hypothetical protein